MTPKVLLATTARWFAVTRLAMALKNAGFGVEVMCPKGHSIAKTSAALRVHSFTGLFPTESLISAMLAARPEIVIPCDDLATGYLHSIYWDACKSEPTGGWIGALLERSLGNPASFGVTTARSNLIALAVREGIRVPKSEVVQNTGQLISWLAENGLPAVLKTDGSSGGVGVRPIQTPEEARRVFASLHAPPLFARAVKRALVDRDFNLLIPFALRRRPPVSVQSLIRGHDATMAVACWQGKVLASISFDVLHVWEPRGPASVVRRKDSKEMQVAAEKIVGKLKLSGLYGFDFMVEDGTEDAFLIEMNPRATQTCHLPLGAGHDLPAALWAAVTGEVPHPSHSVTEKSTIALFPQEWQRNPASTYLSTAYHDVPWEEPELVRACIESRPARNPLSLEMFSQLQSMPSGGIADAPEQEPPAR